MCSSETAADCVHLVTSLFLPVALIELLFCSFGRGILRPRGLTDLQRVQDPLDLCTLLKRKRLTSDLSTVYGCVLSRCCEDHQGDKLDNPFHGDEGLWHPCMRMLSMRYKIVYIV